MATTLSLILLFFSSALSVSNFSVSEEIDYASGDSELSWALLSDKGYNESTTCNQILNWEEGEIRYKKANHVNANERCVWVIHVPGAAYYEVEVSVLTKTDAEGQIVESDLKRRFCLSKISELQNPEHICPKMTHYYQRYTMECRVLIVTFFTDGKTEYKDKGFSLHYRAYKYDNEYHREKQVDVYMISSFHGTFRYPKLDMGMERNYSDNALAVFLFPLENNVYVPGNQRNLMYREKGLYGKDMNCDKKDNVAVYKFITGDLKWGLMPDARMCPTQSEMDVLHDDLMVAVFQSDSSGNGPGFTLAIDVAVVSGD